jgi:hypothetical protein
MNLSVYPIVDDLKMSIDTRNQAPSSKGAISVEFSIFRSDNYCLMILNRILCHCYHRIITH